MRPEVAGVDHPRAHRIQRLENEVEPEVVEQASETERALRHPADPVAGGAPSRTYVM